MPPPVPTVGGMRDQHRSAVYAAEDQLGRLLDRGGTVDFFGSRLTLPIERKFADRDSIARYVERVLAMPGVAAAWPGASVPQVRERKGATKATYEGGVLAIPLAGTAERRWAARETVVLHELAHHLVGLGATCITEPPHGAGFCGAMLVLVDAAIGPEVALVLRAGYDSARVPVAETR